MPGNPLDDWDDWIEKACEADPMEVDEPIRGTPLSDDEIPLAKARLARWQPADAFIEATTELRNRCQPSYFFNQPAFKFLHDAYVLAEFVRHKKVDAIRLASADEQWPDGIVKSSCKEHNVEVTSTYGGRFLGKEYRKAPKLITLDPMDNWIRRADSIPKYLDEAICKKAEKKYSSPFWLVVYLNISECDIRQSETVQVIADTKARYAKDFEAIFVLWKRRIY